MGSQGGRVVPELPDRLLGPNGGNLPIDMGLSLGVPRRLTGADSANLPVDVGLSLWAPDLNALGG